MRGGRSTTGNCSTDEKREEVWAWVGQSGDEERRKGPKTSGEWKGKMQRRRLGKRNEAGGEGQGDRLWQHYGWGQWQRMRDRCRQSRCNITLKVS